MLGRYSRRPPQRTVILFRTHHAMTSRLASRTNARIIMGSMPRVSAAHLAARRQHILDAASVCFMRNGFHQTSMQDVVREGGLSIGAVYRYFPSKNHLIKALAEQVIDELSGLFDELARPEPPLPIGTVMQRAVQFAAANSGPDGRLRMAIQIWSESLRDADLAAFVD